MRFLLFRTGCYNDDPDGDMMRGNCYTDFMTEVLYVKL